MTEPVYSRAPDVVWRLGPDRVLVRRVGATGDDAAAELMGQAAIAWMLLPVDATVSEPTAIALGHSGDRILSILGGFTELGWARYTP